MRKFLHVVVDLDSTESHLQRLLSENPSLHRNTEIIWLTNHELITEQRIEDVIRMNSSRQCTPIPTSLRSLIANHPKINWFSSPLRFHQLIFCYSFLYKSMTSSTTQQMDQLQSGVAKLSSAHELVNELKSDAVEKEKALAEKRVLANNALEMISNTMKSATDKKNDLIEMRSKAQQNSKLLMERKAAIEIELREVEPILREAVSAVGQIKSESLSEIRSLRAPPDIIRDILEGVLRLMGTKDTSWNSMKSFLSKRGVKEDIRSLNPSRITVENCKAVERLIATKSESFDEKNAKRASAAAAPLAAWVVANVKYCRVIQSIKPLEDEQEALKKDLMASESNMKLLESGLDDVDARVKELSVQLNNYTQEAAVMEIKLETVRNTLRKSEILINSLSVEYQSWSVQLEDIQRSHETIDRNAFYVAFIVTHLSDLLAQKRK